MRFVEHRMFERQYKRLSRELRDKIGARLALLEVNEQHPLLNNHKLNTPYEGYRSINISGDLRLVYKKIETETYYLRAVGTHHQLYGN